MNAKKVISSVVVVAGLLLGVLVACAPAATPSPTQAPPPEATPTQAPPPEATPSPTTPAETPEAGPVYGGTIHVAFPADIATFDPTVTWNPAYWTAEFMVYSALYRFNPGSLVVEPELAADMPQVTEDGSVWTVPLRQGLKFSNGAPLTCTDVKYTWDRMLDDKTGCWGGAYYMAVKGAKEAVAGEADGVKGVKCVDDYTIQFELVEPIAYFDKLMAMPWTAVLNQKHVEEVGEDISINPLGSGPYVLAEYDPASRAVFEKNPYYFREDEPYADRVIVDLHLDASVAMLKVENGETDVYNERFLPVDYDQLKEDPDFKGETYEVQWLDTWFIALVTEGKPFDELKVRQALQYAIDREQIIREVWGSYCIPARTYIPPGDELNYNAAQPYYEHDPEKARELLADAGYPDGLTFKVAAGNYYPWKEYGEAIQAVLEEGGFHEELQVMEYAAWSNSFYDPEYKLVSNHWPYEIPDPSYLFDGLFSKAGMFPPYGEGASNYVWYTTPQLEDMLAAARVESDPVKRAQQYKDLDEMLMYDLALVVPVCHPIEYYAVSENLGGFQPFEVLHARMIAPWKYWSKSGE